MSQKKNTSFDTETVSALAKILNETDLTEIEVEQGEMRIRVSREPAPQYVTAAAPAVQAAPPAVATSAAPASASAASSQSEAANAASSSGTEVPAPMVGTVYMASAPDADPFTKVGSKVKEGETLLIIEAMKVMNQIPAPKSGTIVEYLVSDGDPVEYGQPMLIIE
ncbi:MAG: acetyl-CoA carboxylase biotin carboxyl carrier protein [Pseudomonadota bacterium]